MRIIHKTCKLNILLEIGFEFRKSQERDEDVE